MAETLRIDKALTNDDVYKGAIEKYGDFQTLGADDLKWYMVEREATAGVWPAWSPESDDMRNLFMSFGISREDENDWFKAINGVTDYYNAKRMIIGVIDNANFDSYIDGSTLRLNLPIGGSDGAYYTFYGSTFSGNAFDDSNDAYVAAKPYDVSVYGGATCYLYANTSDNADEEGDIAAIAGSYVYPYMGTYDGEQHPNYEYVATGTTRSWVANATKRSLPHLRASHWNHATGTGHDTPLGIAFLELGIFVIFDIVGGLQPIINTDALFLSTGGSIWDIDVSTGSNRVAAFDGATENASADNRKGIHFAGATEKTAIPQSQVSFRSVNKEYKMVYFCHAGTSEFNSTTNHTYNHAKGYFTPSQADSLYVTEIALFGPDSDPHSSRRDPIAYAKLSTPIKKDILETITFKVSLSL